MSGPSFFGYVRDMKDANAIFRAAADNKCKKISKRLHARTDGIAEGHGYVYDEQVSKIRRWTDGLNWGDSYNPGGKIMIYKEVDVLWEDNGIKKVEKRDGLRKKTIADPNSHMRIVCYYTDKNKFSYGNVRLCPPEAPQRKAHAAAPPHITLEPVESLLRAADCLAGETTQALAAEQGSKHRKRQLIPAEEAEAEEQGHKMRRLTMSSNWRITPTSAASSRSSPAPELPVVHTPEGFVYPPLPPPPLDAMQFRCGLLAMAPPVPWWQWGGPADMVASAGYGDMRHEGRAQAWQY